MGSFSTARNTLRVAKVVKKDKARADEEGHWYPLVRMMAHGVERLVQLKPEFFRSNDYGDMAGLGETLNDLIEEGGYFQRGEKTLETRSFIEGWEGSSLLFPLFAPAPASAPLPRPEPAPFPRPLLLPFPLPTLLQQPPSSSSSSSFWLSAFSVITGISALGDLDLPVVLVLAPVAFPEVLSLSLLLSSWSSVVAAWEEEVFPLLF